MQEILRFLHIQLKSHDDRQDMPLARCIAHVPPKFGEQAPIKLRLLVDFDLIPALFTNQFHEPLCERILKMCQNLIQLFVQLTNAPGV